MLTFHQRRENLKRAEAAPRFAREIRAAVCGQLGIPFGPVRLGAGCGEEAEGTDGQGNPIAWMMTGNREAVVKPREMD